VQFLNFHAIIERQTIQSKIEVVAKHFQPVFHWSLAPLRENKIVLLLIILIIRTK